MMRNFRFVTVSVVALMSFTASNAAFAQAKNGQGHLSSAGTITQSVDLQNSVELVQGAVASRQAVNLVSGKSVEVNDVTQTVKADELVMGQIAVASTQAANAVVADSPEVGGVGAIEKLVGLLGAGKLLKKGK